MSSLDLLTPDTSPRTGLGACLTLGGIFAVTAFIIWQIVILFTTTAVVVSVADLESNEDPNKRVPVPVCGGCSMRAEDLHAADCFIITHDFTALATRLERDSIPTWDPLSVLAKDAWVTLYACTTVRDRVVGAPLFTMAMTMNASHAFATPPIFVTLPRIEVDQQTAVGANPTANTNPSSEVDATPFVMVSAVLDRFVGSNMAAYLGRYLEHAEEDVPSVWRDVCEGLWCDGEERRAETRRRATTLWQIIPLGERMDARCSTVVLPFLAESWGASTAARAAEASAAVLRGEAPPATPMWMPPPLMVPNPTTNADERAAMPVVPYFPTVSCVTMGYLLAGHRIESQILPSKERMDTLALTVGLASGVIFMCRGFNCCCASHQEYRRNKSERILRREAASRVALHARGDLDDELAPAEVERFGGDGGSAPASLATMYRTAERTAAAATTLVVRAEAAAEDAALAAQVAAKASTVAQAAADDLRAAAQAERLRVEAAEEIELDAVVGREGATPVIAFEGGDVPRSRKPSSGGSARSPYEATSDVSG
jgi:hypothetical protein